MKTLSAGHAETASHSTSYLAAHTYGSALAVGDENRFYVLPVVGWEQVFDRAVHATHAVCRFFGSDAIFAGEQFAVPGADVGHFAYAFGMVCVNPLCHLFGGKGGHSHILCHFFQLRHVHAKQGSLNHSLHSFVYALIMQR